MRRANLIMLFTALLLSGCATASQHVEIKSTDFSFHIPEEGEPIEKCDIKIGIVRPISEAEKKLAEIKIYNQVYTAGYGGLLADFIEALKLDLEKIISAKGMQVMGVFKDIEDMTYSQKKDIDLIITPKVDVFLNDSISTSDLNVITGVSNQSGTITGTGWVSLVVQEPLSSEKLWVKKIELTPTSAGYTKQVSTKKGIIHGVLPIIPTGESQSTAKNAQIEGLNNLYRQVVNHIWNRIDPEEFQQLQKQASEIKELKRY